MNHVVAECQDCGATRLIREARPVYYFVCPECGGSMVREDAGDRFDGEADQEEV